MKMRNDFVSNSSSCSFVVACNSEHIDTILKSIAKSCEDKGSKYHDASLVKRNLRILDFCVNTYQLLFLGSLKLGTEIQKRKLDDFKKMHQDDRCQDEHFKKALEAQALSSWEHFKKSIACAHEPGCDEWTAKTYGRDSYDAVNDEITHYRDIIVSRVVVSNNVMSSTFSRYHFKDASGNERPPTPEEVKCRVENIISLSKKVASEYSCFEETSNSPDIYQVTQDTIDNTRELIAAGYEIEFDKWEDLSKLENMVKSGDTVFAVRVARDGDGYGDFYIYTENESGCIGYVPGLATIGCID